MVCSSAQVLKERPRVSPIPGRYCRFCGPLIGLRPPRGPSPPTKTWILKPPTPLGGLPSAARKKTHPNTMDVNLGQNGIAILGGGVAGLAVLAALHREGIRAEIFDRAPSPDPRGMGFILMPNGVAAVRDLFPALDWPRISRQLDTAHLASSDGTIIQRQRLSHTLCVSRTGLINGMTRALPAGRVHYNAMVVSAGMEGEHLHGVQLADGTEVRAGAFLGCDGVGSRARRWLHPRRELNPVRYFELLSLMPAPLISARLGNTFRKFYSPGGKLAVGIVPFGDSVVWFVQMDRTLKDMLHWRPAEVGAHFRELLANWPDPVPELLAATDFSGSHVWPVSDLDPLPNYHRGNLLLLGDAAHPMLSFTSQGAGSALEDAVLLAPLLRGITTPDGFAGAFAEFDRLRRPQCSAWVAAGQDLYQAFCEPRTSANRVPLVN